MKPVADHVPRHDRRCFSDQNQKDRLERVLDVLPMPEDSPADAQHHRPVPSNQVLERDVVALTDEAIEQRPVRDAGSRLCRGRPAQVANDFVDRCDSHVRFRLSQPGSTYYSGMRPAFIRVFWSRHDFLILTIVAEHNATLEATRTPRNENAGRDSCNGFRPVFARRRTTAPESRLPYTPCC